MPMLPVPLAVLDLAIQPRNWILHRRADKKRHPMLAADTTPIQPS